MSLGTSLHAAREAAKLSIGRLAALASLDDERIARFESGAPTLSARELDACARALGLRLEDLEKIDDDSFEHVWAGRAVLVAPGAD